MVNNDITAQNETFNVITYTEEVSFKYTLPGEDEEKSIEHEMTVVWEEGLEKFIEEHGTDKTYKINMFKRMREQKYFIDQIEAKTEDLIDEVQEEIANKMKFGFEFSGQLHNDD